MNVVHRFESLGELLAYAQGDSDMAEDDRHSRNTDDNVWSGTGSFGEAVKLAKEGWSDVRPQVDLLTEKVNFQMKEVTHNAFQPVYDVQGAMVDVRAYLSGEPECMIDFLPIEQSRVGRVVTLIVQIGAAGSVSADNLLARCAAISALVDTLAVAQHSCEIWVESTVRPSGGRDKVSTLTYVTKVKDASERFDVDSFAFTMGHPSMLRRVIFSCRERESASVRKTFGIGQNYGQSIEGCSQADNVGATIVVKGANARSTFGEPDIERDPVQWIQAILKDLGLQDTERGEE